jgi:hypothetical protein
MQEHDHDLTAARSVLHEVSHSEALAHLGNGSNVHVTLQRVGRRPSRPWICLAYELLHCYMGNLETK